MSPFHDNNSIRSVMNEEWEAIKSFEGIEIDTASSLITNSCSILGSSLKLIGIEALT